MSIIGTGIAAAVANAGQAARTQAAHQSGRDAQRADHASQTDKLTISQLHDASATRDADEDLPDQQHAGYENMYQGDAQHQDEEESANPNDRIHDADAPRRSDTDLPLQPTYAPNANEHPLFHALDVKA
ncbi:MAG: hypothetical protein ACE37H_12505 [Phycisphaeraceae bacterium]